jgi:endonuclease/exonuclease/phosphatase family metal-dependent hydrolase
MFKRRHLGATLLAVFALIPLAAPVAANAGSAKPDRDLRVMTRNLYLGADLIPLASAPDRAAFEAAAGQRYDTVLKNDYATRAKALAKEIAKYKPDVIGVQEAAVWKKSPDGVKDGSDTPASETVYDSTEILLDELKALKQDYKVAAIRPWFDFEAPTAKGFDVRLTQNDVVLVRRGKDAKITKYKGFTGGFKETFVVPTQVGNVDSPRGWAGIDGTIAGRKFRFVTTHLEAYSPEIADTQMKQLLSSPLKSKTRQSILVGDFNSDPKDASTDDRGAERDPSAYASALDAGFFNPLKRRETCCFAEDLTLTTERLDSWIDHIVARPKAKATKSAIVGSKSSERSGGLWPSDHAGIYATLRLK